MEDKFSFIVNGKTIVTTEDVNLLDFLRDLMEAWMIL
jgi:aldehyde oxidoreductase